MMPSGVPPMPSSRSTPVPSRAAMIAPATSPSAMNLIRAPASRTSLTRPSWRGRSRMTTVTSSARGLLRLGDPADVHGHRRGDVHEVGGLRAGDELVHVEDRGRVEHRAALGDRQHGRRRSPCPWRSAWCRRSGPRRRRTPAPVPSPTRSPLKSIGAFVLLALADDHDAVHRDGVRPGSRMALTAAPSAPFLSPRPTQRPDGHGAGLGDPDELQGEVAVGGLGADLEWGREMMLGHRSAPFCTATAGRMRVLLDLYPSGRQNEQRAPRMSSPWGSRSPGRSRRSPPSPGGLSGRGGDGGP